MVDLASGKKLSPTSRLRFGEVVGQRELKEALLAVAAADGLDGLLIRGEKGTAKSTAVRGLVDLLPDQRAVADCPFGCHPDDASLQCSECRERTDPPVETRPVPLVTLPLGATRERVVGTLSVADALDGDPEFDPGLLARAHRGLLYVDEVNLLDDHLVDVLLDAAASGVNRVERDGVSVTHPAEFTLVGTMNPEEGDLRPQFRDRFALQATVTGSEDVAERVAIIDRALGDHSSDSKSTSKTEPKDETPRDDTERHRERLLRARDRLPDVALPESFKRDIAELCRDAGVEGHRGDVATARAARALAALDDRPRVLESDVRRAAELAVPHRVKSRPFEDAPDPEDVLDDHFEDESDASDESGDADGESSDTDSEESGSGDADAGGEGNGESDAGDERGGDDSASPDEDADADESGRPDEDADESGRPDDDGAAESNGDPGESPPDGGPGGAGTAAADGDRRDGDKSGTGDQDGDQGDGDDASGDADETATPLVPGQERAGVGEARAPVVDAESGDADCSGENDGDGNGSRRGVPSPGGDGARVRTERASADDAVDAAASVRAAASRGAEAVGSRDLRRSVRSAEESALVVFAVDASASMRGPMRAAKGVVLELLRDAYQQRDEVAVVAFAGDDADVVLPPTDSVSAAARHLKALPTGDRTPLPAGVETAAAVLERSDPAVGVVVLVTDGRANAGGESPTAATRSAAERLAGSDPRVVVVDAGDGDDRSALTGDVARITGAERVPLDALTPERVEDAVSRARE
jgi:magnesium chelatase subunit D